MVVRDSWYSTIGRSGSQGIHSICKAGGIGTIGRSGSQGIHSICKTVELVLLVEVVVREFIVFINTGGIRTIG